jgi:hypothetical protein
VQVEVAPELAYPSCTDAGAPDAEKVVASGQLRSGPFSQEKDVVERFTIGETSCGSVFRARQEWHLEGDDVVVVYDESLTPIWAWKRATIPGSSKPDGNADIRRYELRAGDVFIKKRTPEGVVATEKLLPGGRMKAPAGARVGAVIGPGRGIASMWIRRAKLAVGDKSRELVLDFRSSVETLEMATLERNEDRFEPSLGKTLRVYTFFGRETVFTDEHDVVVGDLAGMRPSASLPGPEPAPLPTFGEPDPVHTP